MKIKPYLKYVTGAVFLVLSVQAWAQDLSREEKVRLLEEKRQEIERLGQDNAQLMEQISDYEATITDYRSRIEMLDEQIQEQKDTGGEIEDNS